MNYLQTVVSVVPPTVDVELPLLHFSSVSTVTVVVGKYSEPSPVAVIVQVHSVLQLDKVNAATTANRKIVFFIFFHFFSAYS